MINKNTANRNKGRKRDTVKQTIKTYTDFSLARDPDEEKTNFNAGINLGGQNQLRLIPLSGLGEVGRNMNLLEYNGLILIIDIGFKMPEESLFGIDYVIPDIAYLKGKEDKILGTIITHGHYDHIGAIPYIYPRIGNPPLHAGKLAKGIILKRQERFPLQPKLNIEEIEPDKSFTIGPFEILPFRQNHNIPDNFGFFIKTPVGNIVHTSDFKFDKNPVNDPPTDFRKLRSLGNKGVLFLMSDSTGAEIEGHSLSEQTIFENLDKIFKAAKGRIIASTFASHLNRIQQMIMLSEKYGRKIAIEGTSMKDNVEIARRLKYIKVQKHSMIEPKEIQRYPDQMITFICTGAQGENGATLMKIVNREYRYLKVKKGDTVIFSSSVVPGNERAVQNLKDAFYRQGAIVFHYQMMDIHASGHAHQEELKQMIRIMKPKFFMPIHGQYSMLVRHAALAQEEGIPKKNIVIAENGNIINLTPDKISIAKEKVPASSVMIDGLGIGDVKEVVLRDRQALAQDGIFVIIAVADLQKGRVKGSPDIISRGFVYLRESKDLLKEAREKTINIINRAIRNNKNVNWDYVKGEVKNKISEFLYSKTERRPMVLPVIIQL